MFRQGLLIIKERFFSYCIKIKGLIKEIKVKQYKNYFLFNIGSNKKDNNPKIKTNSI